MSGGDQIAAVGLPREPAPVGYHGATYNAMKDILKDTHLAHLTQAVYEIFSEQHKQLTSDKPMIDSAFGMYTFAKASPAENYSPASAQNSGFDGPSGGRFA